MLITVSLNSSFEDRLCATHGRNLHHTGISKSDNPGANIRVTLLLKLQIYIDDYGAIQLPVFL